MEDTTENIENTVCLAWATTRRHIAVNNEVICKPKTRGAGYNSRNWTHNSISISGLPKHQKESDDYGFSHWDGLIEFKPLDEQKTIINTQSICKKCLKKYQKYFEKKN